MNINVCESTCDDPQPCLILFLTPSLSPIYFPCSNLASRPSKLARLPAITCMLDLPISQSLSRI